MIIKTKCCFLKENIEPQILEDYGFATSNNGETYYLEIPKKDYTDLLFWYKETRRFVYKYPKRENVRFVEKYVRKLIIDGLVEIKPVYEWLAIIGDYRNYSDKKKRKIEEKLNKLNSRYESK